MKSFAEKFYKSKRWQATRLSYLQSKGGLCERCLKKGLYRPAVIVHHKVFLDENTINNPEIALSWSNLEALCRDCHADEHIAGSGAKRYKIMEDGTVILKA